MHSKGLHVNPSALNGIPYPWLKCRVFCSQLRAGTPVLPRLLLQPPGQEGVVDWEGKSRGNVWGCVGLGSASPVPTMSPAMCHLFGACPGSPAAAPLPIAHLVKALPVERRCSTLSCSQVDPDHLRSSKILLQLAQSWAGLWVQSACPAFPVPSLLVRW